MPLFSRRKEWLACVVAASRASAGTGPTEGLVQRTRLARRHRLPPTFPLSEPLCLCPLVRDLEFSHGGTKARSQCTVAAAVRFTGRESQLPSEACIQQRLDGTSCVGQLRARRPARRRLGAVGWRRLAPTAFKMSPLSGLSSLPDHNFTIRANLNTVLLRVSESPWFNLSFAFMHTGSKVYRMALPVRSMRLVRPAKDSYLRALPMSRSCLVKESGAYSCWIASSRSTKSG